MRAAVLSGIPSRHLTIDLIPAPRTERTGDLLIDVEACGMCTTDVHVLDGHSFRPEPGFVLGHEPVGTVVAVHDPSDRDWLGRRVTSSLFEGCGACSICRSGDERLCAGQRAVLGLLAAPGGYAQQMVVSTARAVVVPDALTSEAAAALVDSGSTALNAARAGLAVERSRHLILGGGAIGQLLADILRSNGAHAVIVEPHPDRRSALAAMGHRVLASTSVVPEAPDVVYECSGRAEALTWAIDHLEPRGVVIAAGFPIVPELHMLPVIRKELTIRGVRSGTTDDLAAVLGMAAEGRIAPVPTMTLPLARINDALDMVRAGGGPKPVIDPR